MAWGYGFEVFFFLSFLGLQGLWEALDSPFIWLMTRNQEGYIGKIRSWLPPVYEYN